jgi:FMN-dependent NADH-azoreductase
MYNFGMASTLKTWFDYFLRAGITFGYTDKGPVGLLERKLAIVFESRSGLYGEGSAQVMDSQEPHLRNLLGMYSCPFAAHRFGKPLTPAYLE